MIKLLCNFLLMYDCRKKLSMLKKILKTNICDGVTTYCDTFFNVYLNIFQLCLSFFFIPATFVLRTVVVTLV